MSIYGLNFRVHSKNRRHIMINSDKMINKIIQMSIVMGYTRSLTLDDHFISVHVCINFPTAGN
jgi:hypothetical protein